MMASKSTEGRLADLHTHSSDLDIHEPDVERCTLCAEFCGGSTPLHLSMIADAPPNRVLDQSRNFAIVPSIGPLTRGHVMVVPRRHARSILGMSGSELSECESLVRRCVDHLSSLYGKPALIFEHGSAPAELGYSGACIDHAHLHVVPGPLRFVDAVQKHYNGWKSGHRIPDLAAFVGSLPYLLVGSQGHEPPFFVMPNPDVVPAQFLRQLLASEIGQLPIWDWRHNPGRETFLKTIADWSRVVSCQAMDRM